MPLILHLSDLHLLPADADEAVGDYKVEFVPKGQRQSRVSLLRNTLRGLRLRLTATSQELDAVVVSGDITYQGSADGLALLGDVLSELGDQLPDPSRIVVIPGNHDVAYGTAPGSVERYEKFIAHVRSAGYVTPRLDGIDSSASHAIFKGDGYIIAAMNSCDYSVAVEPLHPEAQQNLDTLEASGAIDELLSKEIKRLRLYDAARMNSSQLTDVADAILAADPAGDCLRIATFHHHLQPVTLNEELKAFESFSNLGEIRQFLADSNIDVVMHGHKHNGRVFMDGFSSLQSGVEESEHACLVLSCGTIGAQLGVGHEVAKLLRVDSQFPRTRRVAVQSLPALSGGSELPKLKTSWQAPLRSTVTRTRDRLIMHGNSSADVHEALEDLYRNEGHAGPLICIIDDAITAATVPPTYPPLDSALEVKDWFAGQIRWWQSATVSDGKPFTHGDYIRRWRGSKDQLMEVVETLRSAPRSSRAVVTLFDPPGALDDQDVSFPSFTVLAFKIRDDYLDATALFRKQEMRYWWAINVAEISSLQAEVAYRVSNGAQNLSVGRITTVTSETVFSEAAPKVAVPLMDQLAWSDGLEFSKIASALLDSSMPNRNEELTKAEAMFRELVPPKEMPSDGPYVPVAGPAALLKALKGLADCYGDTAQEGLIGKLSALVDKNRANGDLSQGKAEPAVYAHWQEECTTLVMQILDDLQSARST